MDSGLSQKYQNEEKWKQPRPGFELKSPIPFLVCKSSIRYVCVRISRTMILCLYVCSSENVYRHVFMYKQAYVCAWMIVIHSPMYMHLYTSNLIVLLTHINCS